MSQESEDGVPAREEPLRPRRRELFAAAGVAAATGIAGWAIGAAAVGREGAADPSASPTGEPSAPSLDSADARPGITAPAVPQRHVRVTVLDIPGEPATVLAAVRAALSVPGSAPADAGEVTVTAGFGARLAGVLWPDRAAADLSLPAFAKDVAGTVSGGDLVLQVCAETAAAAADRTTVLLGSLPGAVPRWSQLGARDAPTPEGTTRTPSGFIDGIINPRTSAELAAGVWTAGEHRDTYAVFRRMRVDAAFANLPTQTQEEAVGRRRDDGTPLSGGEPMDEVDLFAKTPDGRVLTPLNAHARRAHPANLGRALMLRRSYAWDPGTGMGLIFIAFLNDPSTFVLTQKRLDESDDFLAHSSADAIGMFFVPGDLTA